MMSACLSSFTRLKKGLPTLDIYRYDDATRGGSWLDVLGYEIWNEGLSFIQVVWFIGQT